MSPERPEGRWILNRQWQVIERRLLDLLADRATFGLTRSEAEELRQLAESVPDFDAECLEKAAATIQLAFTSVEPLPATVHAKLRTYGETYLAASTRD